MVEMENSHCDQDVHHKQLQAARGSRVCVYGRLRIRVLSVGSGCEFESYPSEEQVKERFPQCVGLIVEWRTI